MPLNAQIIHRRLKRYNHAQGKLLTINLGNNLQRHFQQNPETAPARTALAEKNNPEQCLEYSFSRKELPKAPEQKSGLIVEQMQKLLHEQNYDLKSAQ